MLRADWSCDTHGCATSLQLIYTIKFKIISDQIDF